MPQRFELMAYTCAKAEKSICMQLADETELDPHKFLEAACAGDLPSCRDLLSVQFDYLVAHWCLDSKLLPVLYQETRRLRSLNQELDRKCSALEDELQGRTNEVESLQSKAADQDRLLDHLRNSEAALQTRAARIPIMEKQIDELNQKICLQSALGVTDNGFDEAEQLSF
jgi:hypothetical protein